MRKVHSFFAIPFILIACVESTDEDSQRPSYSFGSCATSMARIISDALPETTDANANDTAYIRLSNDSLYVHVDNLIHLCKTSLQLEYKVIADTLIVDYEKPEGDYYSSSCVCASTFDLAISKNDEIKNFRFGNFEFPTVISE